MFPMRFSTIFKSRWMALVWAIGIIVVAWEVAGPDPQPANSSENAEAPTDVTGAPINPDDENKVEQALQNL
jgi:hypothetical protein